MRYAILNVHLVRPIGSQKAKHAEQVAAITSWAKSVQKREPRTVIVVLGDFNDDTAGLLPMVDSVTVTDGVATHLNGKAYDHIFTTGKMSSAKVVRPPLPLRPNDQLKAMWSDHYLVSAEVGP